MRRRTFTVFPAILAAETILSKSNSLSTFTKTPLSAARTKSSSNFPFPLKMHLVGSNPAASASLSSLPLTRTAPQPNFLKCSKIFKLLLALIAYPIIDLNPSRASL
uniref:Uncharacterized protein n=1 Tax=Opuntia streptacantha TaxID=393608 RepID=A0A7C9A2Z0_OPUST